MNSNLLIPLVAKGALSPFFIAPAAGATPFSFIRLARSLNIGRPVYSFEPPGMESDILPYDAIEDLAAAYLAEIKLLQASGPYFLGGHCSGAIIALEITTQLEAQGDEVTALILLEAITPKRADATADGEVPDFAQGSISMERFMQTTYEHISSQLALLPEDYAERFGKTSFYMLHMADQYHASHVKAPIVLIRTQTHSATLYEGWNTITTSGIEEHIVPGDAFSMLALPVVETVAEKLDQVLRISGT